MASEAQMNQLQSLYIAYFGRPADAAGVTYWTPIIDGETSFDEIAGRFMDSDEFTATSSDLNDVVTAAYANGLGREAGADEVAFWVGQIEAGKATVASLLEAFRSTDDQTDSQTLENKILVANAYTAAAVAGAQFDTAASVALLAGVDNTQASVDAALEEIGGQVGSDELTAELTALAEANQALVDYADEVEAFQAENDLTEDGNPDTLLSEVSADTGITAKNLNAQKGELADLQVALTAAQNDLAGVQAEVNAVPNLARGIAARDAQSAAADALSEAEDTATALQGLASAAANSVVTGAVYVSDVALPAAGGVANLVQVEDSANAGTFLPIITINAAGAISVASLYANTAGIQSLLQAVTDARQAEAAEIAAARVKAAADQAYTADLKTLVETTEATLVGEYDDAVEAVSNDDPLNLGLVEQIAAKEADIALFEEAAALAGRQQALLDAQEEAQAAVADLGVNLVTSAASMNATAEDDLFIVNGDAGINLFGLNGVDRLFVGTDYVKGTGDLTKFEGDASVLEVFFVQNGADTDVVIETKAFASNSSTAGNADLVTITLTGTNAADLSFENGFVVTA